MQTCDNTLLDIDLETDILILAKIPVDRALVACSQENAQHGLRGFLIIRPIECEGSARKSLISALRLLTQYCDWLHRGGYAN